jgi:hypothetical protein
MKMPLGYKQIAVQIRLLETAAEGTIAAGIDPA